MTFGTSVQLLGFSFFTWRTGVFQDAATRRALCKSAPWALPGSCLEAETLRPPPSRDSQNQSLPCNKVPRWLFLTLKFDKHWSWWLFPKTRRKSYRKKKRKRGKLSLCTLQSLTYFTEIIIAPGCLFLGKHMQPLVSSIKKSMAWFYKQKFYRKSKGKKRTRLSKFLWKFVRLFFVTGEDEHRLTSPER